MPQYCQLKQVRNASQGQSLQEYGLVFGCIIAVSIIALTTLGGNLNRFFQDAIQNIANESSGQPGTVGALITSLGPSAVASSQTIRLTDGTIFKINRSPQSISQDVENLGTDGGTLKRLNTLDQLITSLRIQGKEDEANQLQGLSNSGHQLAQAQKLLKDIIQETQNDTFKFTHQGVTFRGQHFSNASEFATTLGILGGVGDEKISQNNPEIQKALKEELVPFFDSRKNTSDFITTGTLLTSFVQEYVKAKENPFLQNNPEVKNLIQELTQEILLTSDAVEGSVNLTLANKQPLSSIQGMISDTLQQTEQSSIHTNAKSQTICKTGNGKDTGTQCL
jgi:Flp pilus assembly pilin Flp